MVRWAVQDLKFAVKFMKCGGPGDRGEQMAIICMDGNYVYMGWRRSAEAHGIILPYLSDGR
jgi:hypothetical protein